jgi:hypothetical protein
MCNCYMGANRQELFHQCLQIPYFFKANLTIQLSWEDESPYNNRQRSSLDYLDTLHLLLSCYLVLILKYRIPLYELVFTQTLPQP